MAKTKIITDSACDLPEQIAQDLGIRVIPLSIRFGEDEYTDRVDLDAATFWEKCKASPVLPETAAPSPGAFQLAFEAAHAEGYDGAVCITLSSALSATYQAALAAAEAVASTIRVEVIDSKAVTMAQGLLAIAAAEAAQAGGTVDDVVATALSARERTGVVGAIDTLEHLKKGGRVGGARAVLGSMLAIKPILQLKDGVVEEAGRQRTRNKALAEIARQAGEQAPFERVAIVHGASEKDAERMAGMLGEVETDAPMIIGDIGSVVGTHGGPGIIGICWIRRA